MAHRSRPGAPAPRCWPAGLVLALCAGACGHSATRPSRVALLPLDGIGVRARDVDRVEQAIVQTARGGSIAVVDREQARRQVASLATCRARASQQGGDCALVVGERLGASHVVFGALGRLGNTWLLRLKLLRVDEATVTRAVEETLPGSSAALEASLSRASARLFDLPGPRPWYARWWVWTVAGVALSAAVVLPVTLTRGPSDPYRDIPFP